MLKHIIKEKKVVIIIILILLICSIAIAIGVYAQITNTNSITPKSEEEEKNYEDLKSNFNSIFDNTIHKNMSREISSNISYDTCIQVAYNIQETKSGKYDIDIKVPIFDIESDVLEEVNNTIIQLYIPKIIDIVKNAQSHTIYNISYVAYINNNIISLVIKCTLKDGTNPQRVMMQTFNYDIENNKILSLEDIINSKELNKTDVQNKINEEIQTIATQTQSISQEYSMYQRDPNDSMYKIENTDVFFLGSNGYLYVLYSYGNNNFTSQVDIIIF